MAENERARGRRRRVAGRGRARAAPRCSPSGVLSVQLLPQFLELAALPPLVVGDVVDAAPAVYVGTVRPADGGAHVSVDECGCVDARGEILGAMLDPASCDCRIDVLDAGGPLFPINWAAVDCLRGAVQVAGALYLDPGLDPDTPYGAAVVLCRRRYEVRAVRRYVWTGDDVASPVLLAAAPEPGRIVEKAVYVADLVAAEPAAEEAVPTAS